MSEKHPVNRNLNLTSEDNLYGLQVLPGYDSYIEEYLARILDTIKLSVVKHKRVTAIRFDLRFPEWMIDPDGAAITRFMESLKAKLCHDQLRRGRNGKRVYSPDMRYLWTRERSRSHNDHYHCCIFISRDAYLGLGSFRPTIFQASRENMAFRIIGAWASALGMRWTEAFGLVHFPKNRVYHINQNSEHLVWQMRDVFRRLSYFAKPDTKHYGAGRKNFGSSRK